MSSNESNRTVLRHGSKSSSKRTRSPRQESGSRLVVPAPAGRPGSSESFKTARSNVSGSASARSVTAERSGSDQVVPNPIPSTSTSRQSSGHSDPFRGLQTQSINSKGPFDPQHHGRARLRGWARHAVQQQYAEQRNENLRKRRYPLTGFKLLEPFYHSKWPGIVWHKGVIERPTGDIAVVARLTETSVCGEMINALMENEDYMMEKLDHRYILRTIDPLVPSSPWGRSRQDDSFNYTIRVFEKCGQNLEDRVRRIKIAGIEIKDRPIPSWIPRSPLKVRLVKQYMYQIAQALSFMHQKDYVHTRIHPSSIRLHGTRQVRLSRLMCVRRWAPGRKYPGDIPTDPKEYSFISHERFRQEIDPKLVFTKTLTTEQFEVERARLYPHTETGPWDGKMDDVWAFGCVVFFLLTAKYPFSKRHSTPREVLEGHNQDFVIRRARTWRSLTTDARDFILWILKPNEQERPTMDQIVNHPWLGRQIENPKKFYRQDYLSNEADVRAKTFRQIPGYVSDHVVKEMAAAGYSIQYPLGQGSFGAVYQGYRRVPETGDLVPIAMKMIKRQGKRADTFSNHRWYAEYKIMTTLKHPNLIEVYDVFKEIKRPQHGHSTESRVFIFMEKATMDLANLLRFKRTLTERQTRFIMAQVFQALKYLHQNKIAHRDIKTENILVIGDHNDIFHMVAKLTDYSISREVEADTITDSQVGTVVYMSPELLLKRKVSDSFKVDVWALAITMYACVKGNVPDWDPERAAGESVQQEDDGPLDEELKKLSKQISESRKSASLIDLMTRMTRKVPAHRYSLTQVMNHPWMNPPQQRQGSQEPQPGPSTQ